MSIDVYDNFFTEEEHLFIIDYCIKASYFYGEGGGSDSNSPTLRIIHYQMNHI
jgi:hypothetical protein